MDKKPPNLTNAELESLDKETLRDLNLITKFYYDVVRSDNQRGIIKKITPRQLYEFIKRDQAVSKTQWMQTPQSK